jgi:hypothetical protein
MKRILLFLLLVPTLSLSQVSSWRSNTPTTRMSSPSIMNNTDGMSSWRNSNPKEFNRPQQTKPGSNIIVNNNPWGFNNWGWGWNRWDLWGAPAFGWNFYSPMWYWNDWGYRQPSRVYVFNDGRRDTINGKKPIINFGLHKTTNQQIGGYFAVGNKGYFIMDFVSTYEIDRSTFYEFGRLDRVDFPLISDLKKERTFYLGGGVRHRRTGFHTMIGLGREVIRFRGKDDIGEITFPKSSSNFVSAKVGLLHDIKNFTIKVDADPIRDYVQFGLGLNF